MSNTVDASCDKFMPEKKRPNTRKGKCDRPWITPEIKHNISCMFELLKISKQTRLPEDYQIYKSHLNNLTRQKEKAKNDYYREKSELYGSNKSKVWSLVNEITNYKRKCKTNIKSLNVEESLQVITLQMIPKPLVWDFFLQSREKAHFLLSIAVDLGDEAL